MNTNLKEGIKEKEMERGMERTKWLYFISILGKSLLNIQPKIKLDECIFWKQIYITPTCICRKHILTLLAETYIHI